MSKILIVEDNAESRYMLERLLTSKGHRIITAENGEDALRLARQNPPEVIISDIMMPVMNGFRLCREVKKDASLRNIPFIFYTATFVEKADEKLAMSLGASRFVVKPTEGKRFIQILDEVLDEHRQGILPVPEGPLEGENILLEMYDNSVARKLAETVEKLQDERKALIKSERRLKEAQELAHMGHWELDFKSNSLECSDEIYRILGLKPKEFDASYEAFMAFVHPDDRAYVTRAHEESLAKKTQCDIECRVLLKDGTIKYVNERFQTIYGDDGMPTCLMGTVQDITERKRTETVLRESEKQYRSLVENSLDVIFTLSTDGTLSSMNPAFETITGWPLVEMLGKPFAPIIHPDDLPLAMEILQSVLQGETPPIFELRILTKAGGNIVGQFTATLRVQDGKELDILGIGRDITERKQAEERLRFLSSAVEQSSEGMAIADMEGNLIHVNQAWVEMHGYESSEELVGRNLSIFHDPEQLKSKVEPFNKMVMENGYNKGEVGHIRKDGTSFPTLMTTTLLKDENGKPIALSGIAKDITDIKRTEVELKTERDKLQGLMDGLATTGIGVDIVGADYRILYQNKVLMEAFGDILGKLCYENYMGLDIPCGLCPMEAVIKSRKVERAEMTGSDGRHYEILSAPLPSPDGVVDKAIEVVFDITDRKRAEEESEKLQAQLQQAQKVEAIGTLAGGIAHDFNNILGAIIGYTEIADLQVSEGSKAKESLKEVLKAGRRARDLVKQILTFSRRHGQERIPVQISPIVKEALKFLRSSMPATIEISQDIESDTGIVEADPTQIHQILMNLCTNAAHAMREEGGILEVGIRNVEIGSWDSEFGRFDRPPGNYLRLTVSDTGKGMTPEVLERIFEPYFTTKEKGEGTGLGLSVVHGIVKNYGGTITAYSEPGKGTTFHVYLPVVQKEAEGVPKIAEFAPIPTGNEHILFIDDEPALVEMGKQMLERLGYKVTTRTSSMEALELFKAKPDQFDLVITDMTMPHMTGERLAGEIINIRSDIPVVICTGYSVRISEEKAKDMGIKAFVMKPFVIRDLAKTVREVLEG
jgi:PAS domain S-box-containing protein